MARWSSSAPARRATSTARRPLTIVDLRTGGERIVPLARAHEDVSLSGDGSRAYLTGGYLLGRGAWDGLTVIDVETGTVIRELPVPDRPLGIAVVRRAGRGRPVLVDVQLGQQPVGVVDALQQVLVVLDHLAAHVHPEPLLVHEQLVAIEHVGQ